MSVNGAQKSSEVYVRHASDLVHWVEGSGPVLNELRPLASDANSELKITLIEAPKKMLPDDIQLQDRTPSDLKLTHKPGLSILWRLNAGNGQVLNQLKEKNDSDLLIQRPLENSYRVNGTISDSLKKINPREFNLSDVGNFIDVSDASAKGHEVKIYRSPSGTKMGSIGGLQGRLLWDSGEVASWAIIICQVTLKHITGSRSYLAQADINGDFRLAFSALPFPKMEGDSRPPYECELSVTALKSVSGKKWHQPDDFIAAELKKINANEFSESIDLSFQSGTKQRVKSFSSDAFLVLKETA